MRKMTLNARLVILLWLTGPVAFGGFCFPGVDWRKTLIAAAFGLIFAALQILVIRRSEPENSGHTIIINSICMGFFLAATTTRKGIQESDWAVLHGIQAVCLYMFIGVGLSHAYRKKFGKPACSAEALPVAGR